MSKFLTAPQWYDAGGGLNKSLDVNCNGSDTATAFGNGANATDGSVAIGTGSTASVGVAVGTRANAGGDSVAIGNGANAPRYNGQNCIAIGLGARCVVDSKPFRRIQFFDRTTYPAVRASLIGFCADSLLDLIYPIGSIYISVSSTNPDIIFGGTWEAFATGKTLVGVDAADTDFNAAGNEGGSKTVTLTKDQMPAHKHALHPEGNAEGAVFYVPSSLNGVNQSVNVATSTAGGSQPHDNMPPYITVYMWKRTA